MIYKDEDDNIDDDDDDDDDDDGDDDDDNDIHSVLLTSLKKEINLRLYLRSQ